MKRGLPVETTHVIGTVKKGSCETYIGGSESTGHSRDGSLYDDRNNLEEIYKKRIKENNESLRRDRN